MVLFGTIQTAANGWRAALWVRYVDWGIVWRFLVGSTLMFLLLRTVAILPSKAMLYLGLGLMPFAADLLPKRADARHHAAGRALHLRRLHHRAAAAGGRGRPHPRRVLPEEPARPQDHRRHQGGDAGDGPRLPHRLLRLVRVRVRHRHPLVGLCGGDRAVVRRHVAGRARAAAHDRRRLSHVEPARDDRRGRRLPGARAVAACYCGRPNAGRGAARPLAVASQRRGRSSGSRRRPS